MRLVHTSQLGTPEVKVGDLVTNFRGEIFRVTGWDKPKKPVYAGRIYVTDKLVDGDAHDQQSFFPSVFDCAWID